MTSRSQAACRQAVCFFLAPQPENQVLLRWTSALHPVCRATSRQSIRHLSHHPFTYHFVHDDLWICTCFEPGPEPRPAVGNPAGVSGGRLPHLYRSSVREGFCPSSLAGTDKPLPKGRYHRGSFSGPPRPQLDRSGPGMEKTHMHTRRADGRSGYAAPGYQA